jgi:DNA transformation protein
MSVSKAEQEFAAYAVELMQPIGPVSAKRMFGGYGIFLDGLMFGIIVDSVLYFKVDAETESEFKERSLEPFLYNRNGKDVQLSYSQAPEEALENIDDMISWANKAIESATRAAAKKRKK